MDALPAKARAIGKVPIVVNFVDPVIGYIRINCI
jgi:hypothetical protein